MAKTSKAEAKTLATEVLRMKQEIKVLKEKTNEYLAKLRQYIKQTGETDLGEKVEVYAKRKPAKLVSLDEGTVAEKKDELLGLVKEHYIKQSLDIGKIQEALESDMLLKNQLDQLGLSIEQDEDFYVKHR